MKSGSSAGGEGVFNWFTKPSLGWRWLPDWGIVYLLYLTLPYLLNLQSTERCPMSNVQDLR